MGILTVLINYLVWHYSTAVLSLFGLYRNLFVFFSNFFSLPILIRTWFSPWRRLDEKYPKNIIDLEAWASVFILNLLMRVVGFFMRTIIIGLGLIFIGLLIISFPIILVIWLLAPFLVIFLFLLGLGLIFFK